MNIYFAYWTNRLISNLQFYLTDLIHYDKPQRFSSSLPAEIQEELND